jgi:hypothetical protein
MAPTPPSRTQDFALTGVSEAKGQAQPIVTCTSLGAARLLPAAGSDESTAGVSLARLLIIFHLVT